MSTTRYIVNNETGQTISGDLTINGNVIITGTTSNSGVNTYKALLTQTAPITGTSLGVFDLLIVGETYTILSAQTGDDFSNIANVISGTVNETGCVFIASGDTPLAWGNGTELASSGNLVVDVLENSLGFDITWEINGTVYFGYNSLIGYQYNQFPYDTTFVVGQNRDFGNDVILLRTQLGSWDWDGDCVVVTNSRVSLDKGEIATEQVLNKLLYTPIEISMKQDTDTTPLFFYYELTYPFPFENPPVVIPCCNGEQKGYFEGSVNVTNMEELIDELNSNSQTSYLGVYTDEGSGIIKFQINTNIVNRFCSNGTFSFIVGPA